MRSVIHLIVVMLIFAVACSAGAKGEACDDEGKATDCDEGLVCARGRADGTGDLVCLRTCVGQESCEASENCNGVAEGGRLKACQPK